MRCMTDFGIARFGAYIPRLRLDRAVIAATHGWMAPGLKGQAKGSRAFTSWDEDAITMAVEAGCLFTIDTDAHAPGQLDWQVNGCGKAVDCGVPPERIVNTWDVADLLAWTADHDHRP